MFGHDTFGPRLRIGGLCHAVVLQEAKCPSFCCDVNLCSSSSFVFCVLRGLVWAQQAQGRRNPIPKVITMLEAMEKKAICRRLTK